MMTDRWINVVLGVIVVLGLIGVAVYERPRAAAERAELLGEDVLTVDGDLSDGSRGTQRAGATEPGDPIGDGPFGVTASAPLAADVGVEVLERGGNAVDAAVAMSYALGVVEPFGSGIGGGGVMLVYEPGAEPVSYDYREVAPASGGLPTSNIGVPGFVAGMAHVHERHGSLDMASLIDPAISYAEGGFEVDPYLTERLESAAHRLPINRLPRLFPRGGAIQAGEVLTQPEYAEALVRIAEDGPATMHGGPLGDLVAEAVSGLEPRDLAEYEVVETPVAVGSFAGYDLVSGGPPVSGPTLVAMLQIAEELGVADLEVDSADYHHAVAQAFRAADADRTARIGDPSFENVDLEALLDPSYAAERAAEIPERGFLEVPEEPSFVAPETDTTHVVVVDGEGMMVSTTNTLSNFFGSGLPVSGFFLNDQLKNFSGDPASINAPAPGKRPRSFITPTILARDGQPLLGIGSPGGRRIPSTMAQVLLRWALHDEDLDDAVEAPRFHLEARELHVEDTLPRAVASDLRSRGYEILDDIPVTEYYGAIQALSVDPESGDLRGVADERRGGLSQTDANGG